VQKEVFKRQLKISEDKNLPVIIHTRDSIDDTIEIVQNFNTRGVFHAFNYGLENAKKIIDLGFYIGIGGVVTYRNSRIYKTVKDIPIERILLETDAPYLTPYPHRGKRNEPAYTVYILKKIAEAKSIPIEEVAKTTYKNTKDLFGIKTHLK